MNIEKIIPLDYELIDIFGVNDKNLKFLKTNFKKAKINVKGNVVYISGDEKTTSEILKIFDEMLLIASRGDIIEIEDLKLISSIKNEQKSVSSKTSNVLIHNNKNIKVKNLNQLKYMETIENSTITFGIGPAGTGKTFLAVASAVKMYSSDQIKKIVLTRPAVEAGERLGYLPGDLSQKIDPYLVPLFDSLEYFFGNETLQHLIDKRNIEIVPLAYMRGRTLNDACIILDEAQNAKVSQIKMFLTRLGENSKMIITGDESQIDLINKDFSGLKKTRKSISNIDEISVVEFQNTDIVRNKIVSKILEVFPDK
jgi:phosphate starvation-inducible PhoH-like protein